MGCGRETDREKEKGERAECEVAFFDAAAVPTLQQRASSNFVYNSDEVRRYMGKVFSTWGRHGVLPLHPQTRSESNVV